MLLFGVAKGKTLPGATKPRSVFSRPDAGTVAEGLTMPTIELAHGLDCNGPISDRATFLARLNPELPVLSDQPEYERLRRTGNVMLERAMELQAVGKSEEALQHGARAIHCFSEARIIRSGAEALTP
jgi:hypothetical protein